MRSYKTVFSVFLPILIIVLAVYYFGISREVQTLPELGSIGHFQLTDSESQEFSDHNLNGKVWVANFIFTSCQGVCPMMTKNMSKVFNNFKNQSDFQIVSISVDPETDTPEVLQSYAKKYNVENENWHFLTGDREKIKKLMFEDFKLGYADDVIFHSDRMVLVDQHNKIRGYYTGTDGNEFNKLSLDIARLLKE